MRAGCKGHRDYEWALVATTSPRHWLLIRCKISDPADLAFFYCHAPALVSLSILIKVAGKPWPTEENFQAAKGLTGLDEHQVRTWASWHRWTTPGHDRLCLPHHHRRRRARPPPGATRPDLPHPQRDRQPADRAHPPARPRCLPPPALVHMAQTPPAPRPKLPLPAASQATMNITNYGWST